MGSSVVISGGRWPRVHDPGGVPEAGVVPPGQTRKVDTEPPSCQRSVVSGQTRATTLYLALNPWGSKSTQIGIHGMYLLYILHWSPRPTMKLDLVDTFMFDVTYPRSKYCRYSRSLQWGPTTCVPCVVVTLLHTAIPLQTALHLSPSAKVQV